jgi:hypothetical protein
LTIAGTALSVSASAKTMFGDLPPSSSSIGTSRRAHVSATFAPVAAEPTNVTWATPGCSTSAAPVSPSPVATWNIPRGTPASSASCASRSGVMDASSDGLRMTALPAASAGAAQRAATCSG